MKNKKLYIIFGIISGLIFALIALFILFALKNTDNNKTNIQNVDANSGTINEINLFNNVNLSGGSITKNGEVFIIEMIAKNNSENIVDMSTYRISLRDINNKEIEYFSGAIFGKLTPNQSLSITVESYEDLSGVNSIVYEDFAEE